MNQTQTGIAVALALTVVIALLIFPGLSPFGSPQTAGVGESQTAQALSAQDSISQSMDETTATPLTELKMQDAVVGTGEVATSGDTVTVNYVGALTDGTVFDASSRHSPNGFTFTLGVGQVIKGWDQGVAGMRVGGKRVLAIPAALAYGNQAVGNIIPANSDLLFEVELLKVEKQAR